MHAKSKSVSILTRFSLKIDKICWPGSISHRSKTAHEFIVNFSTTLMFLVYAGKSRAVLDFSILYLFCLMFLRGLLPLFSSTPVNRVSPEMSIFSANPGIQTNSFTVNFVELR